MEQYHANGKIMKYGFVKDKYSALIVLLLTSKIESVMSNSFCDAIVYG